MTWARLDFLQLSGVMVLIRKTLEVVRLIEGVA